MVPTYGTMDLWYIIIVLWYILLELEALSFAHEHSHCSQSSQKRRSYLRSTYGSTEDGSFDGHGDADANRETGYTISNYHKKDLHCDKRSVKKIFNPSTKTVVYLLMFNCN